MVSKFDLNFKSSSPIAYAIGDQTVKRGEKAKLYIPIYMPLIEKGSTVVVNKKPMKSANMIYINDESCRPNISNLMETVNYIEVENRTSDVVELKNGDKVNCHAPLNSLCNIYF